MRYRVDTAFDAQQGMHRALSADYDAMVVDRGLPVMDGTELVALLRSRGITTPALMLTARGSVQDRVEGLDAGAQDYLVKPFEIAELLARVRALLRRNESGDGAAGRRTAAGSAARRVSGDTGRRGRTHRPGKRPAVDVDERTETGVRRPQLLLQAFDGVESDNAVDLYVPLPTAQTRQAGGRHRARLRVPVRTG